MSSPEDGTRGLWQPVVYAPTTTGSNNYETIRVCINGFNSRGQEVVLSWYRVTRTALLSSPSAALASIDRSNPVDSPLQEEILQRNVISADEYVEDEEDGDDEEEDNNDVGVCGASKESIEGLEKVRVEKGLMGLENSCPICLDVFKVWSEATKMPCNHVFHTNCIEMWLQTSNMCPLCRYKMPQHDDLGKLEIFS